MVVHGHGQLALHLALADHELVQVLGDLDGRRHAPLLDAERLSDGRLVDDVVAQRHTLGADVHSGTGDHPFHLAVALAAK